MLAALKTPPVEAAERLLLRIPVAKEPDPSAAQGQEQEQPEGAGWVALVALELQVAVSAAPAATAADTRPASAGTRCMGLVQGPTSAPSPTARSNLISIAEGEGVAATRSIPRSATNRLRPWAVAGVQSFSSGSIHNSLHITWGTRR